MIDVVTARTDVLDFRPRGVDLPDAPGPWRPVWSASLDVSPGVSRLHSVDHGVVLVDAPSGMVALGPQPPGAERELAGERLYARPAVDGSPVLIDSRGSVHRFGPSGAVERVWASDLAGTEVEAIGLAGGQLLLQRPRRGVIGRVLGALGAHAVTELVDPAGGCVVWRRSGDLCGVLPKEDALFAILAGGKGAARLRLRDGGEAWRFSAGEPGIRELVALVGGKLWLNTYGGEILAVEAETGAQAARFRVPQHKVPIGVVDERARLHLCDGAKYTVLDLAAGGAHLGTVELPAGRDAPSQAVGSFAMPTSDGRLVFFDVDGGVFAARAGSRDVALLRRPTSPLLSCRAAYGLLYVLTRDGELSALSPSGSLEG